MQQMRHELSCIMNFGAARNPCRSVFCKTTFQVPKTYRPNSRIPFTPRDKHFALRDSTGSWFSEWLCSAAFRMNSLFPLFVIIVFNLKNSDSRTILQTSFQTCLWQIVFISSNLTRELTQKMREILELS